MQTFNMLGLGNLGLNVSSFVWWPNAPKNIRRDVNTNMLGLPNLWFVTLLPSQKVRVISHFSLLYVFLCF